MGLGNPFESVVHHLLIEEMDGLDYRDEFPIMSALVCMTTYWTGLMVSYDLKLSSNHYLIVRNKNLNNMIWCNRFGIRYLFNDISVLLFYSYSMYCTLWAFSPNIFCIVCDLGCIRSYTEDASHRFLANKWLVHNRFVGLGNPLEVVVNHSLIGLEEWLVLAIRMCFPGWVH